MRLSALSIGVAAACLAGALVMFCGAHFSHIYAGHLTNLEQSGIFNRLVEDFLRDVE